MKHSAFLLSFLLLISTNTWGTESLHKLSGVLKADAACTDASQLFLSKEKNLLFQIEVPPNGSFMFKLLPGEYHLEAINKQGCHTKKIPLIINKDDVTVTMKLEKK